MIRFCGITRSSDTCGLILDHSTTRTMSNRLDDFRVEPNMSPQHCNPLRPPIKTLFSIIPHGFIITKKPKQMTGQLRLNQRTSATSCGDFHATVEVGIDAKRQVCLPTYLDPKSMQNNAPQTCELLGSRYKVAFICDAESANMGCHPRRSRPPKPSTSLKPQD